MTKTVDKTETRKPKNAAAYKKAIALGKNLAKKPNMTKADIAREMFALIKLRSLILAM